MARSREHTGTILDGDVERTRRVCENALAMDARGFEYVQVPAWFLVKLLDAYEDRQKRIEDEERNRESREALEDFENQYPRL